MKTDLVIVYAAHESIENASDRDAAFDVGHIRASVQRMARAIQLVGDVEWRLMALASFEVARNYGQMARRLLGKNIEQNRVHFETRIGFLCDRLSRCFYC